MTDHARPDTAVTEDNESVPGPSAVVIDSAAPLPADLRTVPFRFLTDTEVENLPPPGWLVDGVLPARGFVLLFGDPGLGKSFVALDLALATASSSGTWLGRRVTRRGGVVYVAAEGMFGQRNRIRAWKQERHMSNVSCNAQFLGDPLDLLNPMKVGAFIHRVKGFDPKPVLVVLDTLARCMPGGDENSPKDMSRAVESIDRIIKELGCSVLLIHHPTKKGGNERGSGVLRGAADTVLRLRRNGSALILECEKQKDAEAASEITVRLRTVTLSGDDTSCVVALTAAAHDGAPGLKPKARDALQSLASAASAGMRYGDWSRASGLSGQTFDRARLELEAAGCVRHPDEKQGRYTLTAEGADTAKALPKHCHGSDPNTATTSTPLLRGGGGSGRARAKE